MKRILIVHDRQTQRGDRRRFLERSGFEVSMMNDSEACLSEVERAAPDLVVMDVLLDGPNGFEVCRRLRTRYKAEELPILLCAGIFQSDEYSCEATAVGAQDILPAVMESRELVSKVVEHLNAGVPVTSGESDTPTTTESEVRNDAIAGGTPSDYRPATH